MTMDLASDLMAALRAAIGDDFVKQGSDIPVKHWSDATEMTPVCPKALLLPGSTAEVSAVLALCFKAGQPVVIQGGLTGLAAGAQPQEGEIALSLQRLNGIEEIDIESRTMIAFAGTPLHVIHEEAQKVGLHYGVDLGARGSCTIGGNVATNAGGVQAVRYGVTRRNVLGLEAVLSDGTVLTGLNKMLKNNTGYDWPQLMIGSEGTLGVITRVSLSLSPAPPAFQTALCAVSGVADAAAVLGRLEQIFPGRLVTFEGMWREYMDVTAKLGTLAEPFAERPEITLLIEAALGDGQEGQDLLAEALSTLMEEGRVQDAVLAQSLQDRQRFWAYREANYEFHHIMPAGEHFDISLPMNVMDAAIAHMRAATASEMPGSTFIAYGHMADSNLHLAVYPDASANDAAGSKAIVYDAVGMFKGSISAEHGIGMLKRPYLSRSRTPAELALMKSLKQTFDPAAILNRDRIFAAG
ncbi:FAD-binding oxidoreductase [Neorhizobium alkalisoli]|uniref:FAD/FMN-containing dehydrogenase n=1 Tax=Neorhizobium alkalisoli TaxID=528178 RepID=A0A561R7E5_9HYPH|nr:FAD-binding oxidoreductase [Neorhizobium alkalisoli]TWF58525.1 FAD/FMN-containing dehydrogenase [Neorhizobium alkalisoli]